uniref:1-aminocyclopropane-1-carboxylate oxidase homolog n=1 Tax=Nicotiana tabacum TaxID=4097 RepID=A0A1S3YK05_TOBAC|nr:PREDICTED: 1-aminocyclopropane-1-carboxylate oxidase homolog [Nicotiana tabacum]
MSSTEDSQAELTMDYDRLKEINDFDDTKAGVKGLVDSGIVNIPRIFIRPPDELVEELNQCKSTLKIPVVDLSGVEVEDQRKKIVDEIREASEKWGFFQQINHGVPSCVLEGMILGIRKFHEQDVELKKEYYTRNHTRRIRHTTLESSPMLSNDMFVSVNHRVIANKVGPRMSVACFFTGVSATPKIYV